MTEHLWDITPFDPATATEADWDAIHALQTRTRAERHPDDAPPTREHSIASLRDQPSFLDLRAWTGRVPGAVEVAGLAIVIFLRTEENQHLAQFDLNVAADRRRQGLGTQLLARIAMEAAASGRRLLITTTFSNVPAGAICMAHLGAQVALESHSNQLVLAAVDPALLATWQARAQQGAPEFELGLWEGPYPEAELPAIVDLTLAVNEVPFGDLEIEQVRFSAEHLRSQEAALAAQGKERWTYYVRERATGILAGYSEVMWQAARPTIVEQGITAVWPQYRGRGLGRWLKAAMIAKILRELPQARFVRTDNADSNAPMLKINQELGFRPYQSEIIWQVPVDQVRAYLATRGQVPAAAG